MFDPYPHDGGLSDRDALAVEQLPKFWKFLPQAPSVFQLHRTFKHILFQRFIPVQRLI